jgi:hypothetical protein
MNSTVWHEASHAIAARALGLPITYLSIRPHEGEAGRVRFDTATEGFAKLDDFSCAIIKVSGEVGARMADGATQAQFNWFAEGGDAEDARSFIGRVAGDELDNRHWATFRAYALLRSRWDQVEAVAAKLERSTTLLGVEVDEICKQVELRNQGWTDSEIRAGGRKLTKARGVGEALAEGQEGRPRRTRGRRQDDDPQAIGGD